ncbi:MAG: response regulator transcription factor [Acidobacteria bacterium]|nr:response regulator transcription factor [Acidobacteriota bacterium]MCI0623870.1 response regulator transcription factor [Acidobacteriota bacterium]MCI0720878.1 response regulator transcription factor [Acidobacteriota bacterium]
MQILIVEDEGVLRDGLLDLMRAAGHRVDEAADGLTAVKQATAVPYDLVLLDLMLPTLDGIEVCRRIRLARPFLPILMLTARGSEDDVVLGLGVGADDYVTKPFGAKELLARVEALGRRAKTVPGGPEAIQAGEWRFDLGHCLGQKGKKRIALTARETGILRCLYQQRARAVSRSELLEQVWGARADMETRTVDMTIANLRQKIERDPGNPKIVVTVKGVGYAWGEP